MRASIQIASVSLALIGISMAADGHAAMDRRYTNIPAEALGPALRTLATELKFQIVYASRDVASRKTRGAVGDFSPSEALDEVLSGTGLTYRYVDERTVTVVPLGSSMAAQSPQPSLNQSEKAPRSFSEPFRVAAVGEGQTPAASSVSRPSRTAVAGSHPPQTLSEITVTAERRQERAVDVPISITALDASTLQDMKATNLQDIQFFVPGLTSVSYSPGGDQYLELRGVSDFSGLPTVGQYFDEMPINLGLAGAAMDVRFLDMERVEVLRGPQPTLYGDGSMGGTIRYIPAAPSLNREPSGAVEADYTSLQGGGSGWLARGHLDLSVIPGTVGLRFAGWYEKGGGWIDRVPTGQKDINSNKIGTTRVTLLAKLSDRTKLKLLWQHGVTRVPNQNYGTDDVTRLFVPSYAYQDSDLLEAVFSADLGFAQLVETPDFLRSDSRSQIDLSSIYVPVLALFGFPPGYVTQVGEPSDLHDDIFYNELRLVSSTSGPWSWVGGFDFKNLRYSDRGRSTTAPNTLPFSILSVVIQQADKNEALWGEVGYAFTDRWHADVGVRYFRDRMQYTTDAIVFGLGSPTANVGTFSSTNPRLDIRYSINPDWNVYFNAGKGFRSGGFNPGYSVYPAYDPDELWTEELGSKGLYWHRKLEVGTDVYYNNWQNVQAAYTTATGLEEVSNTGGIKGTGFDLSAVLRPLAGLELGATFGWNNMSYKAVPPGATHAVGDPPDLASRESWSAFAEYRQPIAPGTSLYGRADIQHADRAQVTLRSSIYAAISNIPARSLLNLRLGVAHDRYDVSVYVENALNERNPVVQAPFGVITEDVSQRPRMYGVMLRTTF